MNLLAPTYVYFRTVGLSFRVPTIGNSCANVWQRQVAILPGQERTGQSRESTRLRCCQSVTRDSESSFQCPFTEMAGNRLDSTRWGLKINRECHIVLDVHLALE